MALKANTVFQFTGYTVQDDGGVLLRFVATDPGAGEPSDYSIVFTAAEIATISTLQQFNTAVTAKLQVKYRAQGISSRLDPLIGRTVTI